MSAVEAKSGQPAGCKMSLESRATEEEIIETGKLSRKDVVESFRFIERANRWLGGTEAILSFFRRECAAWERGRLYRLLDVGCGACDIPLALARFCRARGYKIQVEGLDAHPLIIELARQKCRAFPEINPIQADIFEYQGSRAYDYILLSNFIHHFSEEQIISLLKKLRPLSRRKILINDLWRTREAYFWAWLVTIFAPPVIKHDARLSIRRGFRPEEIENLMKEAGISFYSLEDKFGYRFLLVIGPDTPGCQFLHI